MFESVLVANRGEVAVRIIRTLREMGIRSVLVASVPDRRSLAARTADEVVVLEGYSAAETYLDIDLIMAAAKDTGCQAIHPGYGFLSERADIAERCALEGLVFIGPPPAVLRSLGDKSAARELAVSVGVPVVPGYDGPDDDESLAAAAARVGYPVMIKARGGGGGRGMREVHYAADFVEAVESARREAQSAFGDSRLLLEKLVTQAHHVEVQVIADSHGNMVHLGERDCSVQRRRQKLIEESPSPVVDEALRERLTDAALRIARAANYVNAGTVEFLVGQPETDGARPFYFLEVNPRLQVEHPVTEMRTGLDLVELQLRIAAGERLPFTQYEVKFEGHAIEFRINAEDPWDGFKPSSGRIGRLYGIGGARVDSGYEADDLIPAQYDSLIAKAVIHADSREILVAGADENNFAYVALEAPARINLSLLLQVYRHEDFRLGRVTVDWLEQSLPKLQALAAAPNEVVVAGAVGGMAAQQWTPAGISRYGVRPDANEWIAPGSHEVWLDDGTRVRCVRLDGQSHQGAAEIDGRLLRFECRQGMVNISSGGSFEASRLTMRPTEVVVGRPGSDKSWLLSFVPPPTLPRRAQAAVAGATAITAPLAGTIAEVRVKEGDEVESGQLLVLLDAMKMEHRVVAVSDGTVARIAVSAGDVVREGDVLVELS